MGLPDPEHDPESVRRVADEVLAGDEFQRSILDDAWTWTTDRIGGFFESLFGAGGNAIAAWLILVVVIAIAVVLLVRLGRTLQRDRVDAVEVAVVERRPARDWLREAEGLEAEGAWRDALRCRYRALVGELIERRLLRDVPGRTAGEFKREVSEVAPAAAPGFDGATELFEAAWYGHLETGEQESRRFRALADDVLLSARR